MTKIMESNIDLKYEHHLLSEKCTLNTTSAAQFEDLVLSEVFIVISDAGQ